MSGSHCDSVLVWRMKVLLILASFLVAPMVRADVVVVHEHYHHHYYHHHYYHHDNVVVVHHN
jgi:hypothetical protein